MNTSKERNEKSFEYMLKTAFEEVVEEEMKALPSIEELGKTCPRSPALDRRAYKIIKEKGRVFRRGKIYKVLVRSAAVICILFAVATIAVVSVEASRNFIFNIFYDMRSDHIEIGFGDIDADESDANNISHNIAVALLQEGFEHTSSNIAGNFTFTIFTNLYNDQIIFGKNSDALLNLVVDNENRTFESIIVNSIEVFIFDAQDSSYRNEVLWTDGAAFYSLTSAFDFDINILVSMVKEALK